MAIAGQSTDFDLSNLNDTLYTNDTLRINADPMPPTETKELEECSIKTFAVWSWVFTLCGIAIDLYMCYWALFVWPYLPEMGYQKGRDGTSEGGKLDMEQKIERL